jgi:hypothetical protein
LFRWGAETEQIGPSKIRTQGVDVTLNKKEATPSIETLLFEWELANDELAERMIIHLEDSLLVFAKSMNL